MRISVSKNKASTRFLSSPLSTTISTSDEKFCYKLIFKISHARRLIARNESAMIAFWKYLLLLACLDLTIGGATASMEKAHPPQILEIYRDYLKVDAVAANRKLEKRAEHLCRTLGFQHRYLTIESVSGPPEMWYFNGFDSQAEVEKLRGENEQNTKLMVALAEVVQQKAPLKRAESTDEFATYRSDLSGGDPWVIGRGRFLVIVFFDSKPPLNGTVFEINNGRRMLVRTAQTLFEARALAASAGSTARIFRSYFCFRPHGKKR